MNVRLARIFYFLSRYEPRDAWNRGFQDPDEQKSYLSYLTAALAIFAGCAAALLAIPSVDIRQFSTVVAYFTLSLGLSLLGIILSAYLITTTSARGDQLQLRPNHSTPMRAPGVIMACCAFTLVAGVVAMVLDVPNDATRPETIINWARYIVAGFLGMVMLLCTGILVSSEIVVRMSTIESTVGYPARQGPRESLSHTDLSSVPPPPPALPGPPRRRSSADPNGYPLQLRYPPGW